MSDSQRPNPLAPSFEVPDLELDPLPRSPERAAPARPLAPPAPSPASSSTQEHSFGASFDFGDDAELGDFELERTALPTYHLADAQVPRSTSAPRAEPPVNPGPSRPTGRAPQPAELELDPLQLSILAGYGDPPRNAPLTLAYAYRVFTRQRELKRQLVPIAAECKRAQSEREATLAELARAMRPALEQLPDFKRFFAPLLQLERRALERGRALTAIDDELSAASGQLEAELTRIAGLIAGAQQMEVDAQRQYDEREANAQRAEAKLKRVQIEMRAVMQVAERKLGPPGGQIPEPEATQLVGLQQCADALEPELQLARSEFARAQQTRSQLHARLAALRHAERQITRQKQALCGAHQKQLSTHSQSVSELEIEQRSALAEIARALLVTRTVEIPETWLARVLRVCAHADQLIVRAEMQRRAIYAYDAPRARQGVRLACTIVGLLLVLCTFKLIF